MQRSPERLSWCHAARPAGSPATADRSKSLGLPGFVAFEFGGRGGGQTEGFLGLGLRGRGWEGPPPRRKAVWENLGDDSVLRLPEPQPKP